MHYRTRGSGSVKLFAAARIPHENGADSSRANDFEVIAVGSRYEDAHTLKATTDGRATDVVLRYRGGRWAVDYQAMNTIGLTNLTLTDVAFAAPDDGWALLQGTGAVLLYHYDGQRWSQCDPGGCDDSAAAPLIPSVSSNAVLHLATAGRRTVLYGSRARGTGNTNLADQNYPLVLVHDHGGRWTADPAQGGYDPGSATVPDTTKQGSITTLSVTGDGAGHYRGWAVGKFGSGTTQTAADQHGNGTQQLAGTPADMLELTDGGWSAWTADDASRDYFFVNQTSSGAPSDDRVKLVALGAPLGDYSAVMTPGNDRFAPSGPLVGFNDRRQRWEAISAPFGRCGNSPSIAASNSRSGLVRM